MLPLCTATLSFTRKGYISMRATRYVIFLLSLSLPVLLAPVGEVGAQSGDDDPLIAGALVEDAPEFAAPGPYAAGVQTLTFLMPDVIDAGLVRTDPDARTDRELLVDVWYPAQTTEAEPLTPFNVSGRTVYARAERDAVPDASGGPYPLIVAAHGLNGDKEQMLYLMAHLATYGYVVAAIDHADPVGVFAALPQASYYRPLDIRFVLDRFSEDTDLLEGIADAENAGLIGYSYGGYGALIVVGAGLDDAITGDLLFSPQGILEAHTLANVTPDPRVRALFTFAPYGGDLGTLTDVDSMWNAEGLAQVRVPVLMVAGDEDNVSGYATGLLPLFEGMVNAERTLITVPLAGHIIAQTMPPVRPDGAISPRHNNAMQHWAAAFFGLHLKDDESLAPYMDLDPSGEGWPGWPDDAPVREFELRRLSPGEG